MKKQKPSFGKRANIPIAVLVVGVLVLCGAVILNFYVSIQNSQKFFSDVTAVEESKLNMEKFVFYTGELGLSAEKTRSFFDIGKDPGNEGREYIFREKGNLRVQYYFEGN